MCYKGWQPKARAVREGGEISTDGEEYAKSSD